MRYIFIALALVFAGELEVDGDLKVSGSIDAQNNPIQNVGIPQELTDAINGNVLQDALRDDGNYEYKIMKVAIPHSWDILYSYFRVLDSDMSGGDAPAYLTQLGNEGWKIITVQYLQDSSITINNATHSIFLYTLSRKVENE